MDAVLNVSGLSKKFARTMKFSMVYGMLDILKDISGYRVNAGRLRKNEFWAVDDVSFSLSRGEVFGIIGDNGSGKTTILKMVNGIILPDRGMIEIKGKTGALIEVGAGFHPMLTGRENIYINAAILGMSKKETMLKFDSIVDFAEIGEFIDMPVKFYSNGMFVRLGFSIAIHCEPDMLLVDEILAVGDIRFRSKCIEKMKEIISEGSSVVFVSHNMAQVMGLCDKVLWMEQGRPRKLGPVREVISEYEANDSTAGLEQIPDKALHCHFGNISVNDSTIDSVRLLDHDGVVRTQFFNDEQMLIEVKYNLKTREPRLCFSVQIINEEGVFCVHEFSSNQGLFLERDAGPGKFIINLKKLRLKAGCYLLGVAILRDDYVTRVAAIRDNIFHIKSHLPTPSTNRGIFVPEISWEICPLHYCRGEV